MSNVTLKVEGMSCNHCVNSVEGALKKFGRCRQSRPCSQIGNRRIRRKQGFLERD